MLRRNVFAIAVVACILALVPTISSASTPKFTTISAKSGHKVTVNVGQDHTLAGKMVKGGTYQLRMDDSTVAFFANGKVVAEAPGEWKDGSEKAAYDFIKVEGDAIKEIHIAGQTRYFSVQS
jgi:hypothetical protein